MPEVPAFNGDLSEVARRIYGETIPPYARYAAVRPTRLFVRAPGGQQGGLCLAIVVFWVLNFACVGAIILLTAFLPGSDGTTLGSAMGLLACASVPILILGTVAIWLFGGRLIGRIVGKKTGEAVCYISNDRPRPGEEIDVTFSLPFESEMEVESTRILLMRRETVIYTSGTDRHTAHHEEYIAGKEFMGRSVRAGDFLQEQASFTLPHDAMPTFIANRNRILWFVQVKVAIKGRPDINELYHLAVLP